MWFSRLNFTIPASLITDSNIVLGGIFGVLAWLMVVLEAAKAEKTRLRVPAALYLYTVAVSSDIAAEYAISHFPLMLSLKTVWGESVEAVVWWLLLGVSFLCVAGSLACLKRYSGVAKRTLLIGSIVLIAIDCLGFVLFFVPPD